MSIFFNYNGKIYNNSNAVIGPDNRGLRYGDGIFETIKLSKGRICFVDEHFARLWQGLKLLQFDVPKNFTPEKLQEEIQVLVVKNNHNKDVRIRLNVFKGDGGLFDTTSHQPNYIIQSWELNDIGNELNSNGLELGIYSSVNKNCDAISNIKHNNFLPYSLAALFAKSHKYNDAIVLNNHQRICETSICNIFFIKDKVVYTPSLSEGCIAGVMRAHVINTLKQNGWQVVQSEITEEDLLQADEVFVTNSIIGIKWVKSINVTTFTNKSIQQIHSLLNQY